MNLPIPTTAEQAEAMEKLGYAWLVEHAPDRLTAKRDDASPERIVAAACRIGEVTVSMPPPARHGTILAAFDIATRLGPELGADQGFLTSHGRYVGRVLAREIAYAAGQPFRPRHSAGPELFSEDLW